MSRTNYCHSSESDMMRYGPPAILRAYTQLPCIIYYCWKIIHLPWEQLHPYWYAVLFGENNNHDHIKRIRQQKYLWHIFVSLYLFCGASNLQNSCIYPNMPHVCIGCSGALVYWKQKDAPFNSKYSIYISRNKVLHPRKPMPNWCLLLSQIHPSVKCWDRQQPRWFL